MSAGTFIIDGGAKPYMIGTARVLLNRNGTLTFQTKLLQGLVVSLSASHTVDHEFASRPGHTKDHHKNGTNHLPAWHAMH